MRHGGRSGGVGGGGGGLEGGRAPPEGPRSPPYPQPPKTWMMSADADWSSGATGIALDAVIAARLRPIANTDAASSFMELLLPSSFAAMRQFQTYASNMAAW